MIDFSVTFLEYEFKKKFYSIKHQLGGNKCEHTHDTLISLTLMMKGGFELSVKGSDQTLEHL